MITVARGGPGAGSRALFLSPAAIPLPRADDFGKAQGALAPGQAPPVG